MKNAFVQGLARSVGCIAETAAICMPTMLDSARGTLTAAASDARLVRWAERVLARAEVELHMHGAIPHEPGPFVVMSNHSSFLDIPVVYRLFGGHLRMVAKKELFQVPGFGRAMRDAGFVRMDRQNREDAIRSLDLARAQLRGGMSIWLAPEGTRNRDGVLGPLKKGGFMLALQTDRPILPVSLVGTHSVLPRGALALRVPQRRGGASHRVDVTVHPPIPVAGLPRGNETELRASRDRLLARVAAVLRGES